MATVRKLSVSVSDDLAAMMSDAVAGGNYNSTSEVVREALRDWQYKQEQLSLGLAELKRAYKAGKASGDATSVDSKVMLQELKAEARQRG